MGYMVKNWVKFQHYRNRRPPWIKLHRSILDDPDYLRLPVASMALAPLVWLLASENGGAVDCDVAFRTRLPLDVVAIGLKGLVKAGFLIETTPNASKALAPCLQLASAEGEGEGETEGEEEEAPAAAAARRPVHGPDPIPAPPPNPDSLPGLTAAVIGCRPEFRVLNHAAVENTFKAWPRAVWGPAAADFVRDAANEMQCPPRPLKMLNGYLRKASERAQPSSTHSAPRQQRQTPAKRFDAALRDAVAQYEKLHATRGTAEDFARLDAKFKDQYRDTLALPDAAGRKRYLIPDAREIAESRARVKKTEGAQ
jgi:hypothetical protein